MLPSGSVVFFRGSPWPLPDRDLAVCIVAGGFNGSTLRLLSGGIVLCCSDDVDCSLETSAFERPKNESRFLLVDSGDRDA